MQRRIGWVILFCLLLCFAVNHKAYSFSVEPSRIELVISGGRQKGAMAEVDNSQSDEPLHVKVYVQDIIYLPDGTFDYPAAGSTRWSCANWIKIIPYEIDIPPKRKQSVRISVAVPPDAKGGYYAMVFFEAGAGYIEGVGINFRIGVLMDVTVSNTQILKAELTNMSFIPQKQIEVGIFNQGNVLIRPKGKIKILDAQGKKKIKQLDFNPHKLGILPDTLRKIITDLDTPLANGKYLLKIEIDYGTKYLLVGELPMEIN